MIYCNLKGGLGNMLFQIAATNAMAIKNNTHCSFPNFKQHLNFLDQDKIYNPNISHANEYASFLHLNHFAPLTPCNTYSYPFEYVDVVPTDSNFVIDGFFQSEKYFKNQREQILQVIKPTDEINDILNTKYSFINNKICTSIHVRRGDYLKFSNNHPTQQLEYYLDAISLVPNTEMFVLFSDDIEWCKSVFAFPNVFFVEDEKDYIELFLMSKCKNNIVANSSFSWWGAWLNVNPSKIVIGPKKWFGPNLSHMNTDDIIPNSWIKI